MSELCDALAASVWLYTFLSVINEIVIVIGCFLTAGTVFDIKLRSNKLLFVFTGVAAFAAGIFRTANDGIIAGAVLFLLPYLCMAAAAKKQYVAKGLCAAFVFSTVTEIFKFVLLTMFSDYNYGTADTYYEFIMELLPDVFFFILAVVLFFVFAGKKDEKKQWGRIDLPLVFMVFISGGLFIVTILILGINHFGENRAEYLITLLNIPVIGTTAAYAARRLLKTKLAEEHYREQLDMQVKHYELMEKKNEELRVFRHDFPKKLRPMMMYMRQGNTDEALAIAEEFSAAVDNSRPRFHTGNIRLDTVLECEQQAAEPYGIRIVFVDGSVFPAEGIAADDIYTIFPNALDNAVESCVKCGGNNEIVLVSRIDGDKVYVTVSNPATDKPSEKNGKVVSSKNDGDHHGYGLRSIKKAAASYGSGNCDHIFENGVFTLRFNLKFR